MAKDKAYRRAERKIEAARHGRAKLLDLSSSRNYERAERLSEVPPLLAHLTKLQSLKLSGNNLTALPDFFSQLSQLQSLSISDNKLYALPESLSRLLRLQSLDLSGNQLTTLPEWIGNLSELQFLNISGNRLSALPKSIGRLKRLQSLKISKNQLTSIPDTLGQLIRLKSLKLSNNELLDIPNSLDQLLELQSLDVSSNKIQTLPNSIGHLSKLQSLNLYNNRLESIPDSIGRMSLLQSLQLNTNRLTSLPSTIGKLTELQVLDVEDNRLTSLPESIHSLCELRLLNLSSNRLSSFPSANSRITKLNSLFISRNSFTAVPKFVQYNKALRDFRLSANPLQSIPDWIGRLRDLQILEIANNSLSSLPSSLAELTSLRELYLGDNSSIDLSELHNRFFELPDVVRSLCSVQIIWANFCSLHSLPDWISELKSLESLNLESNRLSDLPYSVAHLEALKTLDLDGNPLNPELSAAGMEGIDAIRRYLRATENAQIALDEAKLIIVGEGEVGKSCLLGALRGDPWVDDRSTTHGIEIKPLQVSDVDSGKVITLNGWDFGGQRVYRPTHQLFFSAPAVYLVVWKPREGAQQGLVREWIKLIKHREPEAKILVVATHGGPKARQPDIDRQELWDLFGKDTLVDFISVESKPDAQPVAPLGIEHLRNAIARVAKSLPEIGRSFPRQWQKVRTKIRTISDAWLTVEHFLSLCSINGIEKDDARLLLRICHRVGDLIHYEHDPILRNIVILKPDWLATAISYVLDDKKTRDSYGLVTFSRLRELWSDPDRPEDSRYEPALHSMFLRLMERYDISYKVVMPNEIDKEHDTLEDNTSLIAQLVPDVRPEVLLGWTQSPGDGDDQQTVICRIVDSSNGQSATTEGLFFQLIVRLHRYSMGRADYQKSVHWQRGLLLDDGYNGRALLEHVGNDIRITVRAPYPQAFLAILTNEVKWLVRSRWRGVRCDVMVPCVSPCGRKSPGAGLFEVQKLIESRRRQRIDFPCPSCDEWQNIDHLLLNSPSIRTDPAKELLSEFASVKAEIASARDKVLAFHGEAIGKFDGISAATQRLLSKVDDSFNRLMSTLADEAKEGPRLFSFEPAEPGFFDRPNWLSAKFKITLWCEHSRLPLTALNSDDNPMGVYEVHVPRDWLVKSAPFLRVLTGTLSLVVPVASSATKVILDDASYKGIEKHLDLGQKSLDSLLKGSEAAGTWLAHDNAPEIGRGAAVEAHGSALRQLHSWLKAIDPGFGGLVRVLNSQHEFLWVHPKFQGDY